jgi:glycosyltransferase involved in cell wall biosynthesis
MIVENLGKKPLVSVLMLTYNHEKFIEQAVRGVLNQLCNFDFELIIAEDCSPDNTRAVLMSVISNHPMGYCVKYTRHDQNLGMHRNAHFVMQAAVGKYIAICEGDDFWSDPSKLQKQVDFLEQNEDYGLVHHEADYFFQAKQKLVPDFHKRNRIHVSTGFVFEELLQYNNIYTPTVVYRRELFDHYLAINENIRNDFLMADYAMWLEFSQHCKFHYLDKSMAVYRVLVNSASHSYDFRKKMYFLRSYCQIKFYFLKRYKVNTVEASQIKQYYLQQASVFSLRCFEFKKAWIFAKRLRLDSIKNIILYIISSIFFYVKPLRMFSKFSKL